MLKKCSTPFCFNFFVDTTKNKNRLCCSVYCNNHKLLYEKHNGKYPHKFDRYLKYLKEGNRKCEWSKSNNCKVYIDWYDNPQRKYCTECKPEVDTAQRRKKTILQKSKQDYVILGYSQRICTECFTLFVVTNWEQTTCMSKKCSQERIGRLRNYNFKQNNFRKRKCKCGNNTLTNRCDMCKLCIYDFVHKLNFRFVDEAPINLKDRYKMICNVCETQTKKSLSPMLSEGNKSQRCVTCGKNKQILERYNLTENKDIVRGYFYIYKSNTFWKYGVTSDIVKRNRDMVNTNGLNFVEVIELSSYKEAMKLEKLVKFFVQENNLMCNTKRTMKAGGKTETISRKKMPNISIDKLMKEVNYI